MRTEELQTKLVLAPQRAGHDTFISIHVQRRESNPLTFLSRAGYARSDTDRFCVY